MEIYSQKSRWKLLLAIAGIIFIIITLIFTQYLSTELSNAERNKVTLFSETMAKLAPDTLIEGQDTLIVELTDKDFFYYQRIIEKVNDIPIIFEYDDGDLEGWNLYGESNEAELDLNILKPMLLDFKDSGLAPIEITSGLIWYVNTALYDRLRLFPYVMALLVGLFIALGYYLFNSARKAEQNRVWAGMAKETAHQLGTPISAIIGWIEHLKEGNPTDDQAEIITELRNDVNRLELVADRFSKIGSEPALEKVDIVAKLNENIAYMDKRAPKKVVFSLDGDNSDELVMVNSHLFNWVIENLYRNALDSMDGVGSIKTTVYEENDMVAIDISDTGKGIPSAKFKTVFQPGYSTKKRGWGLGLSLAKRIIENYHKGKIFVKQSKIDQGSTFAIRLPKA